jgi:VanZ family protein
LILRRWGPPLLWLGAILTATSLPSRVLPDATFRYADKALHFTMYAGLAFLFARAMDDPARTPRYRAVLAAFLLTMAIGALDEWHQKFIQGRSTELADWIADSAGGLLGASTWMLFMRRFAIRND